MGVKNIIGELIIDGNTELKGSRSLTAGGNIVAKNYLQGKWIQSTQLSSLPAASKICVFDKDGWVYYRDIDDLGVRDTKSTVDHSFYLKGYNSGFEDGGINSVDGANNAVFGDHNYAALTSTDEPMSCIVGGSDNKVSTSFSVVGGVCNEVRGTGYNCLVVGRWNSIGDHTSGGIDTPSKNNIVGGEENVVFGVDSMIVGTKNNIHGSYNIVGGASNMILNNGESNIVGGSRNHIDAYSILAVGNDNYIAPTAGTYINYAAAIGWGNRIEHNNAYTFGWGLQTNGQAQFLVGNYNDPTVPGSIRFAVAGGEDADHRANLLTVTSTSTTVHGNLYSQNHTVNGDSTIRGNQVVTGDLNVSGALRGGWRTLLNNVNVIDLSYSMSGGDYWIAESERWMREIMVVLHSGSLTERPSSSSAMFIDNPTEDHVGPATLHGVSYDGIDQIDVLLFPKITANGELVLCESISGLDYRIDLYGTWTVSVYAR